MKTISNITIGLATAMLLFTGCGDNTAKPVKAEKSPKVVKTVPETSLGLRKTDLYSEDTTTGMKTDYHSEAATTSHKIKRAFQDAPPMVPHSVEGMLPIKIGNNQCTGCHMPEVASSMGATPIPVSHFTNFRPTHKFDGKMFTKSIDNYKNETSIKQTDKLQGARFNCSQCHTPQTKGKLAVENTFESTFTRKDGASHSTWDKSKWEDQLDTVIGGKSYVTPKDMANENSPAGVSPWTHH